MNYQEDEKEIEDKDYIEIIDGHNPSGYFWIMPVKQCKPKGPKLLGYMNNWEELREYEISIDESNVFAYLSYILFKHFDTKLEANKTRDMDDVDDINSFVWYLEYNFFTYEQIKEIIKDIKKVITLIDKADGKEEFQEMIRKEFPLKQWFNYYQKDFAEQLFSWYSINAVRDFYVRFCSKMEEMMNNCKETNLIVFMGP